MTSVRASARRAAILVLRRCGVGMGSVSVAAPGAALLSGG
jgi:hypothetical protein